MSADRETLRVVVIGHVDHGKSTLVGRLFHDTGMLPDGKLEAIRAMSEKRGMPFEWAFLMDALQAERDQGITIDTAHIWFRTPERNYVLVDAPGHKEFLKNMVTGAAASDAALLLIDAVEGLREQSRRHAFLLHLLGVREMAVVVNKMDAAGYSEERFRTIQRDYEAYLAEIGLKAQAFIPISARNGENLASSSAAMPWYHGPTVLQQLGRFQIRAPSENRPLRMPVQGVYKFDDRRIIAGRLESGRIAVGDTVLFSPSNKTTRVASIERWQANRSAEAGAGESIGVCLTEQIFVERGEILSHVADAPVETDVLRARLFWLGQRPMGVGSRYKIKLHAAEATATVQSIERIFDASSLEEVRGGAVEKNSVCEITLRLSRLVALDPYDRNAVTGRFVLVDDYDIAGGGVVSMEGYADQRRVTTVRATDITAVDHGVSLVARTQRNGHEGGVLWLTGLSGAGKSTLAVALEAALFTRGYQVYVLDGDNVRHGLCADLGFSPEDRAENIRRVGEVAALMAGAGMIVVTAFISPYRSDRDRARKAADTRFHEIYVKADLAVCETRDPKGLYKKARAGELANFTGISAPYEAPTAPELVVDTGTKSVDACIDDLVAYAVKAFKRQG